MTCSDGASRYWRLIYLLKIITSCILGSVWSLHCTQEDSQTKNVAEPWNKERQIINNTKQQIHLVEPWITTRGGADFKQSCSFLHVVGIFPLQSILGSSLACSSPLSALWPLWSYTDFHEVLEREGSCKLIPHLLLLLFSLWSQQGVDLNQQQRPDVTSEQDSETCGRNKARRGDSLIGSSAWCQHQRVHSWYIVQLWMQHIPHTLTPKCQSRGGYASWNVLRVNICPMHICHFIFLLVKTHRATT